MANSIRALSIGGVLLLMIAVPVGWLIYSPKELAPKELLCGSETSPKFAFSKNYDIWTMDTDGAHPKRLTDADGFEESDPALSPDGSRIAFTRRFYEEHSSQDSEERYDLFIMHTDGSCQTELVHSIASEPAWSPDGKRIAFTGLRRSDGDGSSIYVVNTDGSGEPMRLTSGARGQWDNSPAWSPDGTEIAFVSNRPEGRPLNNYSDIYVTKACCKEGAANRPQRLTDTHGWNRDPAWSPDGTELAYTFVDFGSVPLYGNSRVLNTDIYTMKSDGSRETSLNTYADMETEHDPAWSPSGSEIALIRSSGYYPGTPGRASGTLAAIYVMKSDGSDPTIVRNFPDAVVWDLDWR